MEGTKTEKIESKKKSVLLPVIIGAAVLAVVAVIAVILAGKKDAYRVIKVDSFKGNAAYERDEKQQEVFEDTELVNENNPYYGTEGGIDTTDKIFCLSLSEIESYDFSNHHSWSWLRSPGRLSSCAAIIVHDEIRPEGE